MKLPQALLGAILVGVVAQTATSCKKEAPSPKKEQGTSNGKQVPANCPACGMG
jgi:hypothetical protein